MAKLNFFWVFTVFQIVQQNIVMGYFKFYENHPDYPQNVLAKDILPTDLPGKEEINTEATTVKIQEVTETVILQDKTTQITPNDNEKETTETPKLQDQTTQKMFNENQKETTEPPKLQEKTTQITPNENQKETTKLPTTNLPSEGNIKGNSEVTTTRNIGEIKETTPFDYEDEKSDTKITRNPYNTSDAATAKNLEETTDTTTENVEETTYTTTECQKEAFDTTTVSEEETSTTRIGDGSNKTVQNSDLVNNATVNETVVNTGNKILENATENHSPLNKIEENQNIKKDTNRDSTSNATISQTIIYSGIRSPFMPITSLLSIIKNFFPRLTK